MTPAPSWAHTGCRDSWDGWRSSSYRSNALTIPWRKSRSEPTSWDSRGRRPFPLTATFILKGDEVCRVPHERALHHSSPEFIHGDHHRCVDAPLIAHIHTRTGVTAAPLFIIWLYFSGFPVVVSSPPWNLSYLTGILLKWRFWRPLQDRKCFDDQAFWEVGHRLLKHILLRIYII